jgi:hypothetical protein
MTPVSPVLPGQPQTKALEIVFAKDQPEYRPLPAIRLTDPQGTVITSYQLTWRERWRVLVGGHIWFEQLTFGDRLQPQLPSTEEPQVIITDTQPASPAER